MTALTAAWVAGLMGEPEEMERWLAVAELLPDVGPLPDGTASYTSGVAIVRGVMGYVGLEARHAHLSRALMLEPDSSRWRPYLLWGMGHVALLSGDARAAKGYFDDVLRADGLRQPVLSIIAMSELAIAETELGRNGEAMRLARRAETIAEGRGLTADPRTSSLALALGVSLVASGEVAAGHEALERALELRRSTGRLSPWPTLEVQVALAPVRFVAGDVAGAKALLDDARTLLADLEDAGDLPKRVQEAERLLHRSDRRLVFGESLTDREMAILRLMPTSLSLREIAGELFLSLNTVKTHSQAIYRKLGVSSRKQAVERARDLGLLE